ncbi:Vesicle-associated membrane-protein-associated protein [Dioscorea alata]|uniref:Vesicle-associated membrane-protein-associated protein n=1 Tax=Dioscorea alata TaxID=55571 RepID=A0ACB7VQV8_DIOAL|nr:Vesicle-associated membrane-protein-associated protein [Dioscorea alata]
MAPDLIEIEPRELKFTFELKKQSSCTIQLINNTNSYVAFKIKTTSPKRYCVRPNTGVILPKSTCDFTVTMQAQRVAPADMQLRDKFLVQSTIVPYGTTDENLVPSLFSKETGRQIEESKLRVVLVSPPHSPILQPINGAVKQELTYAAPVLNEIPVLKETPLVSDQELTRDENLHPSHDSKDVDDLKQKLSNLEVKLLEAEKTMSKLREEKNAAVQEKEKLQHDIALLTRKCATRVQVGFPFLFVVFIALVSLSLGYRLHP